MLLAAFHAELVPGTFLGRSFRPGEDSLSVLRLTRLPISRARTTVAFLGWDSRPRGCKCHALRTIRQLSRRATTKPGSP